MNNTMIVGRLTSDPQTTLDEKTCKRYSKITVAVTRSYKNSEGIYETDFIPVALWGGIAENTAEYCRKGDLIGIKGRLEMYGEYNEDNGYDQRKLMIVADKVTFLSSTNRN